MNTNFMVPVVVALSLAFLLLVAPMLNAQEPEPARPLAEQVDGRLSREIAVDYEYHHFDRVFEPWQMVTAELTQRTRAGSVIARVNHGERFGRTGTQVEMDAYPRFAEGTYGYVNVGYSPGAIFPEWRGGAEVYQSLPSSFEGSLGARWLRFPTRDVVIYTGSVGKYVGNYWISARPYVTRKESGTSLTTILSARHYFQDGDHYLGLSGGYGSAPGEVVSERELDRTDSWKVAFEGKQDITPPLRFTWRLSLDRESFPSGDPYSRWGFKVGLEREF